MAADLYVNDSGTARRINEVWVNDAGTARRIVEIWVNDNGVARQIFSGAIVQDFVGSVQDAGTATFQLFFTGVRSNLEGEFGTNYWIEPQSGMSGYEVRASAVGGVSSGTLGSWLSLGSTRTWTLNHVGGPGATSRTLVLEFRRAADALVLETNSVGLVATS